MSILIENALVVRDPLTGDFSSEQSVAVEGEYVQAVGPRAALRERYPTAERWDATGNLLLPGLIDGHTHLYAALTLGMPATGPSPRNFPEVLKRVWWRWDQALDAEDVHLSALVGSIASAKSGVTTMFDHHASPSAAPESLSRVAGAVEEVGLRACLAYEVSDRNGEKSRDEGIAENCRFVAAQNARKHPLIRGLFGLHAVYSLSDQTLKRCAEQAAGLGVGFHMHLAEHQAEVFKFAESHDQSIAEFLAKVGILGPQTLAAHTVHLDAAAIEILKRTETFNVHNPRSNMGNGVGICPVSSMLAAGQRVGLGSDGFYDLPQDLVTTRLLQTLGARDPSALSDHMALQLVYGHNVRFAERLFGRQLGKVEPGYTADLILIAYNPATPVQAGNIVSHIVAALASRAVGGVLIHGRPIIKNGVMLTVDEPRVLALSRERAGRIWARL